MAPSGKNASFSAEFQWFHSEAKMAKFFQSKVQYVKFFEGVKLSVNPWKRNFYRQLFSGELHQMSCPKI